MAAKLGRPKLPKGQAKGRFLSARFSAGEYAEIAAAVKQSGKAKTSWVRDTLLAEARKCVT